MKSDHSGQQWFPKSEIAAEIGIHPRTITRDAERDPDGFPVPLQVGKSDFRYNKADVLDYYRNKRKKK